MVKKRWHKKLILSKYDSDADVYLQYEFKGELISFERGFKQAQTKVPLIEWTYRLDEIGWKKKENYIKFLKSKGYKEEKSNDVHSKCGQAV